MLFRSRTALDWQGGHYYHLSGSTLYRYQIEGARWERLGSAPLKSYIAMDWHRDLGRLIGVQGAGGGSDHHQRHAFDGQQWTALGASPVHGYCALAHYNGVSHDMLIAGGNQTPRVLERIDASGRIHRVAPAPFDLGVSSTSLTHDPVSGDYLVLRRDARELHAYDPERDTWRLARQWSAAEWPFGPHAQLVAVPMDDHGVILWLNTVTEMPLLYRHDARPAPRAVAPAASALPAPTVAETPRLIKTGSGPRTETPKVTPPSPSRLVEIGAELRPGEWRYVATQTPDGKRHALNFMQVRFCAEDGGYMNRATYGNGWMDSFEYDPASGSFWALLMRDRGEKKLVWLDAELRWHVVSMPWGWDCSNNRRPFDRLMLVDGMLYWPPAYWGEKRREVGRFRRAPIAPYLAGETEVKWEDWGLGIGQTSIGQIGDYAFEWFPEQAAFIAVLPGSTKGRMPPLIEPTAEGLAKGKPFEGRLWSLRPDATQWDYLGRLYTNGHRARLLYNPLRHEILIGPGGFSKNRGEFAKLFANGERELLDRVTPPGVRDPLGFQYTIENQVLSYDPVNGDYLWWSYDEQRLWRSAEGREWRIENDFSDLGRSALYPRGVRDFSRQDGLFGASSYIQITPIPGTDLLVFFDPHKGVILHRLAAHGEPEV